MTTVVPTTQECARLFHIQRLMAATKQKKTSQTGSEDRFYLETGGLFRQHSYVLTYENAPDSTIPYTFSMYRSPLPHFYVIVKLTITGTKAIVNFWLRTVRFLGVI